jgi:hypothetical protein
MLINIKYEFPPELTLHMLGGLIVNRDGKEGNFVPLDLHQEQDVLALKHKFFLFGANGAIGQKAMLGSILHVLRGTLNVLMNGFRIASVSNQHSFKSITDTARIISDRIQRKAGFEWVVARITSTFALPSNLFGRQSGGNKATDHYTLGMTGLTGSKSKFGSLAALKARRAKRMGKRKGEPSTHNLTEEAIFVVNLTTENDEVDPLECVADEEDGIEELEDDCD